MVRGDELQRKLNESMAVEPAEIPPDVITMNPSRVRDKVKQEGVYNLVFPSDSSRWKDGSRCYRRSVWRCSGRTLAMWSNGRPKVAASRSSG